MANVFPASSLQRHWTNIASQRNKEENFDDGNDRLDLERRAHFCNSSAVPVSVFVLSPSITPLYDSAGTVETNASSRICLSIKKGQLSRPYLWLLFGTFVALDMRVCIYLYGWIYVGRKDSTLRFSSIGKWILHGDTQHFSISAPNKNLHDIQYIPSINKHHKEKRTLSSSPSPCPIDWHHLKWTKCDSSYRWHFPFNYISDIIHRWIILVVIIYRVSFDWTTDDSRILNHFLWLKNREILYPHRRQNQQTVITHVPI